MHLPSIMAKAFTLLALSLLLIFVLPTPVLAFSVTDPSSVPSEATVGESFSISTGISAGAGEYFVKCRIGEDSSSPTQGETYNSQSGQWLTDSGSTGAWINMPVVMTSGGSWQGNLTCRVKSNASAGVKVIAVRVCPKENDGTCDTSKGVQSSSTSFTAVAPTSTPAPTPSPSPSPSPTTTPTANPTSTSSPSPTVTPKPTTAASSVSTPKPVTPSPTPAGTVKITKTSTGTPASESLVLGITDVGSASANTEESATDESAVKEEKPFLSLSSKQYLAGGLAALGALFLGASVFLFFKEKASGTIDRTDENN